MKGYFCLLVLIACASAFEGDFVIQALDFLPAQIPNILVQQTFVATRLAVDNINADSTLLPNINLSIESTAHFRSSAIAIAQMIKYDANNETLVIGNQISDISVLTGVAGAVYGIAQLSSVATSTQLSNNRKYPYYTRLSESSSNQILALEAAILHYSENGPGWLNVAVVTSSDEHGIALALSFIESVNEGGKITIDSFEQIFPGQEDISLELNEIKKSGARVIVALVFDGWEQLITEADKLDLVGDHYVWLVTHTIVGLTRQLQFDNVTQLTRGTLGSFPFYPKTGPSIDPFLAQWSTLDPVEYPGAELPPSPFASLAYDMVVTAAKAIQKVNEMGILDTTERVAPELWTEIIRETSFDGVTGPVAFNEFGDRVSSFLIVFYDPDTRLWKEGGLWSEQEGYSVLDDVVWFSNTTDIPDLDIRPSFDYWSCDDKKIHTDETGKTISRHTPDGSSFDDIDSDYHCDNFIDCHNLSDESIDCSSNYQIVFIVFGIITGILILLCIMLIIFTFVFGTILQYRRLRVSSPFFMILILVSVIVGYSSVFAWFGKPHPVACGFQPWLLGLSAMSMLVALLVKNFRVWRIFKYPLKKTTISNFELLILWALIMIPAVVILVIWAIVSTPTAKIKNIDGNDHYVCATGGFTGEPGGIVFFSIFLSYGVLILLLGIFFTVVNRKVPSMFNEAKLIAISTYNIAFLCAVIIPVILVVSPINPFIAWIVRTVAILYAFSATTAIQFIPKLYQVVVCDKCKNVVSSKISVQQGSSSHRAGSNLA